MTQTEKELLLRDLCARLPYNVICQVEFRESGKYQSKSMFLSGVFTDEAYFTTKGGSIYSNEYKPYLFPLSSMTEEQKNEYHELIGGMFQTNALINFEILEEFFHKNHFDYRGLISKGLAIDCTNLDIY